MSENPRSKEPGFYNTKITNPRNMAYAINARYLTLEYAVRRMRNRNDMSDSAKAFMEAYIMKHPEIYAKSNEALGPHLGKTYSCMHSTCKIRNVNI